jgi:hypothetical protein
MPYRVCVFGGGANKKSVQEYGRMAHALEIATAFIFRPIFDMRQ